MSDTAPEDYEYAIGVLDKALDRCPRGTVPIVAGDFNASVGTKRSPEHKYNKRALATMGPEGNEHVNELGEMLLALAIKHNLTFATTHFKKKTQHTLQYLAKKILSN